MNETGPEISESELELVKKTTETLQFQDRRQQKELTPAEKIVDVKSSLENYSSQFNKDEWNELKLPNVEVDYDTFIGELVYQQSRILREQEHNFGDLETAKQLLFPTVLRYTSESLSQQKEIQELEKEVYKDGLTELLNQKYFENRFSKVLEEEIASGRDLAVLFIDTDRFKIMNDTLGHKYGDDVLKIVANILHDQVRDLDLVIRKGGDEFALLLRNVKSQKALEVAERLRLAAEQSQMPDVPEDKTKPQLTFSIGVSTSETARSAQEFKEQAEISMYHSKRTPDGQDRKNAVTAYSPGMTMPKGGENGRAAEQTTEK